MTKCSTFCRGLTLTFLQVLLVVQSTTGAGFPVTRLEADGAIVEFPNDPEFVVLRLDTHEVRGRVRVFGDGRVSLFKYQNTGGWQEHEGRLNTRELEQLVRKIVRGGVLDYDPDAVRAKLRNSDQPRPGSSAPNSATLTIRLSQYKRPDEVVTNDFAHSAKVGDLYSVARSQEYYKEAPEVLALAEVIQELLDLGARRGLRMVPVMPPDSSSIPSWVGSAAAADRSPRILYFETQRKGVWSIDWLGRDRRQLWAETDIRVDFPQPPSIAPDSRLIAWSGAGGLQVTDLERQISRRFIEAADHSHSAVWSPTGDWVAVSGTMGDQKYHLVVAHADCSNPQVVSNTSAKPLQWSADGKRLYFHSSSESEPLPKTFVMNRDGTDQRLVLPQPNGAFRVSPDGSLAAFSARLESPGEDPVSGFWTVELQRATGTVDRRESPVWVAREAFGYDWSPDSRFLVFSTGLSLAVVGADGRDPKILVDLEIGVQGAAHPNWSPDGRAIAFAKLTMESYSGAVRSEIWVMGSDGSDPRHIADGLFPHWFSEPTPPVWLPY